MWCYICTKKVEWRRWNGSNLTGLMVIIDSKLGQFSCLPSFVYSHSSNKYTYQFDRNGFYICKHTLIHSAKSRLFQLFSRVYIQTIFLTSTTRAFPNCLYYKLISWLTLFLESRISFFSFYDKHTKLQVLNQFLLAPAKNVVVFFFLCRFLK